MIRLSKKHRYILIGLIVVGLGLAVGAHFAQALQLNEVVVDGRAIDNWPDQFAMLETQPFWRQPLDSVATHLLAGRGVYRVDMQFALPGRLQINTNRFQPMALLLCEQSGRMYGLTEDARVVPLDRATVDWASPVIIGTEAPSMFDYCSDPRLKEVCRQLDRVRRQHLDLYRLIDEIDFSRRSWLVVTLSGLDCRVRLRADRFYNDMQRFIEFGKSLTSENNHVKLVDLCFDNMVVCRTEED